MVFNIIRFKIYVTWYRHMTILIVAPFVVGVVLERFFKALVLFPTCMVVLMVVVVLNLLNSFQPGTARPLGCYLDLVRPASILKPAISGQNRPAPAPGGEYW